MNILPKCSLINGVCFIARSVLSEYPLLQDRIKFLSCQNGDNTIEYLCPSQNTTCRSYIGISINKSIKDVDLTSLNRVIDSIEGIISFIAYPKLKTIEVFDLCSDDPGVRDILLVALLDLYRAAHIWVSYIPGSPQADDLLNLYLRFGFIKPHLTNSTLTGKGLNYFAITLILPPNSSRRISRKEEKRIRQEVHRLTQEFQHNYCQSNIFLPLSTCEKLHTYLDKKKEYAGLLTVTDHFMVYEQDYALVEYDPDSETSEPDNHEASNNNTIMHVRPPMGIMSWHSHPKVAYGNDSFLGFPSASDIVASIYDGEAGLLKHFIVSVEGIYSISLTMDFTKFWATLNENDLKDAKLREYITEEITEIFSWLEDKRTILELHTRVEANKEYKSEEEKQHQEERNIFLEFMKIANNLTMAVVKI
jgi:hypothetical protein